MLSSPDADLVRRDPGLPGLAMLLDPEALAARLREALPDADLEQLQPAYLRYKPGTSCLVGYRRESTGSVTLYAVARRANDAEKLRKTSRRPAAADQLGGGILLLEDKAVQVWSFPEDGRLQSLARIVDPDARFSLFRTRFMDLPGLWVSTLFTLAYKPERRYVARLLGCTGVHAALKLYTEEGFHSAIAAAKAFRSSGPLRVARRLARSSRHHAVLFEWLPGRPLAEAILDPAFAMSTIATVGAALAHLHAQRSSKLRLLRRTEEAVFLQSAASVVGYLCPSLATQAYRLAERLTLQIGQYPSFDHAIHGDFYAQQVLVTEDTAAIVDLDRAQRGDPAIDLGLFLAHLERDALCGSLSSSQLRLLREGLLEGYRSAGCQIPPARIQAYTAVGLLRLAVDPFRYREGNWPEQIERMLHRAIEISMTKHRAVGRYPLLSEAVG